jgi:hypothetical protein
MDGEYRPRAHDRDRNYLGACLGPPTTDVLPHLIVPCSGGGTPARLEIGKLAEGRYRATVGTMFEHQEINPDPRPGGAGSPGRRDGGVPLVRRRGARHPGDADARVRPTPAKPRGKSAGGSRRRGCCRRYNRPPDAAGGRGVAASNRGWGVFPTPPASTGAAKGADRRRAELAWPRRCAWASPRPTID